MIDNFIQKNIPLAAVAMFHDQLSPISEIIELYMQGMKEHKIDILSGLLKKYTDTEALFSVSIKARLFALHEQNKDDPNKVVSPHKDPKQGQIHHRTPGPHQSQWSASRDRFISTYFK